jgi:hypothetical protein
VKDPDQAPAGADTARKLGLLPEEYDKIKEVLGRTPNFTELSIYSAMWSEHCSYKNSIKPAEDAATHRSEAAGRGRAGERRLVDIGDGWACAFKIESHNHPSAIEPYQGAATGVGGINRDIFTMGARPIAQLNSLRFGDISKEKSSRWHMRGVVKGIGDYGNAFGVPVLGGEVYFDPCYTTNPLVNAMSVGIVRTDKVISATSHGVGNPVFIVGSSHRQGRDPRRQLRQQGHHRDQHGRSACGAGGRPLHGEAAAGGFARTGTDRRDHRHAGHGRGGHHLQHQRNEREGESGMDINLDRVPTRQQGCAHGRSCSAKARSACWWW